MHNERCVNPMAMGHTLQATEPRTCPTPAVHVDNRLRAVIHVPRIVFLPAALPYRPIHRAVLGILPPLDGPIVEMRRQRSSSPRHAHAEAIRIHRLFRQVHHCVRARRVQLAHRELRLDHVWVAARLILRRLPERAVHLRRVWGETRDVRVARAVVEHGLLPCERLIASDDPAQNAAAALLD